MRFALSCLTQMCASAFSGCYCSQEALPQRGGKENGVWMVRTAIIIISWPLWPLLLWDVCVLMAVKHSAYSRTQSSLISSSRRQRSRLCLQSTPNRVEWWWEKQTTSGSQEHLWLQQRAHGEPTELVCVGVKQSCATFLAKLILYIWDIKCCSWINQWYKNKHVKPGRSTWRQLAEGSKAVNVTICSQLNQLKWQWWPNWALLSRSTPLLKQRVPVLDKFDHYSGSLTGGKYSNGSFCLEAQRLFVY